MNSTAFLIGLVVAIGYYLYSRRKKPADNNWEAVIQKICDEDKKAFPVSEEDELIAVIAAALAEADGTESFQAPRIRSSCRKWAFTGRQELVHNRL
jgi:hypothetical protein